MLKIPSKKVNFSLKYNQVFYKILKQSKVQPLRNKRNDIKKTPKNIPS